MNLSMPRLAVLLLVPAILYLSALGSVSLWDYDETRNARAAEEMMIRGDLVIPTVNGEVRAHKPPFHYWFMILAYKMFGVGEFSARFFAAVFSIATVLLVATVCSAVLGPSAGLLSGLVLGVSFLFTVLARSATTDAFLVFFTNAAIIAGYFSSRKKIWMVVAWAAMGFAVLAKGPVGIVLPLGALILFRLMDRKGERSIRELMELFPLSGILLFIVIAAPWYLLAAARTGGDLISGFIMEHNIGRFLKPMERHSGPIFYYLPVLLAGFYPWAVFLPQAVKEGLRKAELADRYPGFMRLQVIWAAVVLIFFSVARTKLPNYILPSFPALAFLTGAWIETVVKTPKTGYGGRSVSWAVNIIPALFFPALFFVAFKLRAPDFASMAWIALPMAAPALLGLILHLKRVAPSTTFRSVAYTAAAGVLIIHTILLPHLEPLRVSPRMGRTIAQHAGLEDSVASFGYDRPALFFYGKRPVVQVKGVDSLRSFLALPEGRFVVTTSSRYEQLPVDLKDSLRILEEALDALDTNKVVLVAERIESRVQSPESRGK